MTFRERKKKKFKSSEKCARQWEEKEEEEAVKPATFVLRESSISFSCEHPGAKYIGLKYIYIYIG